MPGKAYIGTSGWNYKSWRDGFYSDTPQKEWLRFSTTHINLGPGNLQIRGGG